MKKAKLSLHWFGSLSSRKEHDGSSAAHHPKRRRGSSRGRRGEEGAEPARGRPGEHAPPSPLLAALSSRRLLSVEGSTAAAAAAGASPRPLPSTPQLRRPSPLTSHSSGGGGGSMRSGEARGTQQLYEPMEPGAPPHTQETASHSPSQDVGGANRRQDAADGGDGGGGGGGGGEYVKFSKEKFWLEAAPPTHALRKQLEEELKLGAGDLRSHAWYHGHTPWEVSEELVLKQGDFLVRDSQSSPGDFVLTARWDQAALHLLVRRRQVLGGGGGGGGVVRFGLQQGEAFPSLPALVHAYLGRTPAAPLPHPHLLLLLRPVNRTLPLAFLETAFGHGGQEPQRPTSPSAGRPAAEEEEEDAPLLPPADPPLSAQGPNHRTPPPSSPCGEGPSPPASGRSTPLPSAGGSLRRPRPPRPQTPPVVPQSFVERLRVEDGGGGGGETERPRPDAFFAPLVESASAFSPASYRSPLMPPHNKPLEAGILRRLKELLAELEPAAAAKHITQADCRVARIVEVTSDVQRMMGVSSGMELLTLPHGQQLRLDLLERFQTMAITLAVEVLGCTGSSEERAALLHKIIRIAAELKGNMGNMFGFAAVMRALHLPQVARLDQTWTALRQRHTEGAILYEKTLRPFMKSLNDGRESCPLSCTTFPHVLPLLSLLERGGALGEGPEPWEAAESGVDVVMFHLGAARTMAQLGGIYRSNAHSKLQGFQEQADVSELFQTDFQMRLLWGSRGAQEAQALRYAKFEQVLTALSNRLEPPAAAHR